MKHLLFGVVCGGIGFFMGFLLFDNRQESDQATANFTASAFEQFTQQNGGGSTATAETTSVDSLPGDGDSNPFSTLTNLEGVSYTDIARLALSPTVDKVNDIIDGMQDSELVLAINSLTGMDNETIQSLGDPRVFSKKLIGVVMRNTPAPAPNAQGVVSFGLEANAENQIVNPQNTFGAGQNRIYAGFSSEGIPPETIMVKWFRVSPYRLQIINRYAINPDTRHNFVWFQNEWEAGLYAVELYSMQDGLTLLASGSFEIVE